MERRDFLRMAIRGTAVISVSGCDRVGELFAPIGPAPIHSKLITNPKTLSRYVGYWEEMAACTGRKRNFHEWKWLKFSIEANLYACSHPEIGCLGFHDDYRKFLYIFEEIIPEEIVNPAQSIFDLERAVVKHEVAHALGYGHGNSIYEKCGAMPSPELLRLSPLISE